MTNEEREQILAEIDELAHVPERQPLDVSVLDLAERWGVTDATVKKRMRPHVEAGLFASLMVYDAAVGRVCRVYRKADGGRGPAREGGGERA